MGWPTGKPCSLNNKVINEKTNDKNYCHVVIDC